MATTVGRTAEQQDRIIEISTLLINGEGERLAGLVCARYGQHLEPDDLIGAALEAIVNAVDRGTEIIDPSGYSYGVMRNAMVGVLGGAEVPLDPETHVVPKEDSPPIESFDQTAVDREFDRIRAGLETSGADTAQIAAALAKLVIGDDDSIDVDDLPQPVAGAAPDEAEWWICAYLATRDDVMFPEEGRAGQTVRKRRSRFISAAKALVRRLQAESATRIGDQ
jgi:hypothetical protein